MKAAIVQGKGETPVYGDFAEPKASEGESLIAVAAAAVSAAQIKNASRENARKTFPIFTGNFTFLSLPSHKLHNSNQTS